MNRALFYTWALLCFCFGSFLYGGVFEDEWLYTKTKDFELISNTSESKTYEIIESLYEFKSAFEKIFPDLKKYPDPHLSIVICKDKSTLISMCKIEKKDGKALANVAGLFGGNDEAGYAIINAKDQGWGFSKEILCHEYVHYLLSKSGGKIPLWFSEGVAMAFQNFHVNRKNAVFGHPDYNARYFITDYVNSPMPLSELFLVDQNSSAYRNHGAAYHFYSTSWAFTHFCLFGRGGEFKEAFLHFSEANKAGDRSEKTFKRFFGMSFVQAEIQLKKYLGGGRYKLEPERYTVVKIPLLELPRKFQFSLQRSKKENVRRIVGGILARNTSEERRQRARDILVGARIENFGDPELTATMGFLEESSGNYDRAIALYEEAIASDVGYPPAYVCLAELKLKKRKADSRDNLTTDEAVPLLELLLKGRSLGCSGSRLYRAMADLYLFSDLEIKEDHLAVLDEGLEVYAKDYRLALRIAELKYRSILRGEADSLVSRYLKTNIPEWARISFGSLRDSAEECDQSIEAAEGFEEEENKVIAKWERPLNSSFQ
jgi:hypothetical protein